MSNEDSSTTSSHPSFNNNNNNIDKDSKNLENYPGMAKNEDIQPIRQNRDHILLECTRSICPDCRKVIDANILSKDGKVYMKKRCKEHGLFESLISSDATSYVNAYKFNRKGIIPIRFGTEVDEGCPHDCGLCPDHEQHSCVGIIEITNACNLRCPTCFSSAEGHGFLSLEQVNFMLDEFIKQEGSSEVVQFSGGEPTIHPQILDMISLAKRKNIKYVMINTNGIRISMDKGFVKDLAKLNPVIYLQFDGFKKETSNKLRGKDLTDIKIKAIENMEKYGLRIIIVSTIQRNINESEIGNLVDFALSKKSIKGIVFQPTFYSGRHPNVDPMNIVTLPEVIKHISEQSKYGLKNTDFVQTPCCFPTCNSSCYLYVDEKEVKPLARVVNVEEYLDYFANRSVADLGQIKESLQVLNSFDSCCCYSFSNKNIADELKEEDILSSSPSSSSYDSIIKTTLSSSSSCCAIPLDLKGIEKNVKLIMIQSFMDPFNFDIKRLMKCCIHEITPTGKIVPICAFNNIPKYREEVNIFYTTKKTMMNIKTKKNKKRIKKE